MAQFRLTKGNATSNASGIGQIVFEGGTFTSGRFDAASITCIQSVSTGLANASLAFYTSGPNEGDLKEKMRITSIGNVGIGTTNPQEKLEVNGMITANYGQGFKLANSSQTSIGRWYNTTGINYFQGYGTRNFQIGSETNGVNTHFDNYNNQVSIGSIGGDLNKSWGKLQINASENERIILANEVHNYAGNSPKLSFFGSTVNGYITGPSIQKIHAGGYGAGRLAILQHEPTNYTNETEVMSIMPDGKVGIGTSSPMSFQHNKIPSRNKAFSASDGTTWHDLIIQNPNNSANTAVGLAFELNNAYHSNAGTGIAAVKSAVNGYGADMVFVTRPQSAIASERMRIMSNGNVGIGTLDPGSYKLAVDGKIRAREVKVTVDGWSDYVFNPDYNLPSLKNLEKFINDNNHLPNIPSEKEVLKEGINLGEMNALLLAKIEELTLYIIDQNKRIERLESQK